MNKVVGVALAGVALYGLIRLLKMQSVSLRIPSPCPQRGHFLFGDEPGLPERIPKIKNARNEVPAWAVNARTSPFGMSERSEDNPSLSAKYSPRLSELCNSGNYALFLFFFRPF